MNYRFILFLSVLFFTATAYAQDYIYTKEGRTILNRRELVNNCLRSLNKNRSDKTALSICECQTAKLDRRFTSKQFKQHTKSNVIDIATLVKEDSLAEKELQDCFTASGQTVLLQAESFESEFMAACRKSIQSSSEKSLDAGRVSSFCQCQLQLVKTKKLSDKEMNTLSNPNSLLFFEMMYLCGSPFTGKEDTERNWAPTSASDVRGPAADTINVLTLNGMTYVKIKVGSMVQVWLFDTGASDLLINTETEEALKAEKVLTRANYLGTAEYEMANGTIDTCRRYRLNGVQIGNFTVNNVVVAVSEKARRIIVGKALLNKFRNWSISNQDNKLLLVK
jgi:hypothetical protein